MQQAMNKIFKNALIFLLCLSAGLLLNAQTFTYGIDPARDSVDFAQFRVRMDSIRQHRPVVALVLSGGGAKGAAHISVLRHLDSIGLHPDMVVGTSIGGLVGGLYACGYSGNDLQQIFLSQAWDTLLRDLHSTRYDPLFQKDFDRRCQLALSFGRLNRDFFLAGNRTRNIRRNLVGGGVVEGMNVQNLLGLLTAGYGGERSFLDLPTPFVCVASDMVSAQPKIWHSGRLVDALRSTMSIPALFSPVKMEGMVLLDGAMRSNFPVEVALQLGADTVIGVDISSPPLTADEINTVMDIVSQTTDVLGRERYDAAVRATDIYIKPDLHDYSLLSFNEADIRAMMLRGRQAVAQAAPRLAALSSHIDTLTHSNTHTLTHSNIDTIPIATVSFVGVSVHAGQYLRHLTGIGNQTTPHDIQNAIERMMGTKAFETITYQLLGPRPPYILQFTCKPAAVNVLGVGVRFDTREMGAILIHAGFNTRSITGSRATIEGRLGQRSSIKGLYGFRRRDGIGLGTSVGTEYVQHGTFFADPYDFQIGFLHSRADIFLDVTTWNHHNIRAGLLLDHWHRYSFLSDYGLSGSDFDAMSRDNAFVAFFAHMRSDTYDDPYFPTRGIRSDLQASLYFPSLMDSTGFFYSLSGNIEAALAAGYVTFSPYAAARYVSRFTVPYMNALSVTSSSRILEQQIPFVGIGDAVACQRLVSTAGLSLRVHVIGKHYVSLLGQALHQSDELYSHFRADRSSSAFGLGLEYAYRSPVGPLRATLHWSSFDHTFGALLNLGVEF